MAGVTSDTGGGHPTRPRETGETSVQKLRTPLQGLPTLAAALIVAAGWTGAARADFVYAYAEQTLTNLTVTGAGLANAVGTGSATSASAAINGIGIATNNPTDTLQAYQGTPPPAPQNDFTKYSTAGGGPQAGDFTRGDTVLTGAANLFTTGVSLSNVAESFLSTGGGASFGPGLVSSSGNVSVSGSFTAATTSSVSVNFGFANDIIVQRSGTAGPASSSYAVIIAIKDQHGHEIDASPTSLQNALTAPPNGPEVITSGTGSALLNLGGLTSGDTFSITISSVNSSSATIAAVPEPSSMVLAVVGGLGLLGYAHRRLT